MQSNNCCQFSLIRQFLSFFRQFIKLLVGSNSSGASAISEGDIFIYSCSAQLISLEVDSISKEINCAEPEYMNMSPSLIALAPLLGSNTVNNARKIARYISKSKLILCEYSDFYLSEIAFIGFAFYVIQQCICFFFGQPVYLTVILRTRVVYELIDDEVRSTESAIADIRRE